MVYKTPKHVQEQKEAKSKHILETARKVFAAKGFHETTVQDICTAAGVSIGSIYFYFPNKDSIYEAVYHQTMTGLLNAIQNAVDGETEIKNIIEKIIKAIVGYMTSKDDIPLFFRTNSYLTGLKHKRNDTFKKGITWLSTIFAEAVKKGQMESCNPELAAITFVGSIYNLIKFWNSGVGQIQIEETVPFLTNYNIRGLKINK